MLFKVAWRNIWRSKTRSFVVIFSVMLGIWALIFLMSFMQGMISSYISNAIKYQTSHIQIHNPAFKDEPETSHLIDGGENVMRVIKETGNIEQVSGRLILSAMVSSANAVRGLQLRGVNPENEIALTHFSDKIVEGAFLTEDKRNPIVISAKTADNLNVRVGSKVVITFQDPDYQLVSAAFRVVGLFDTGNRRYDETLAFTAYKDLHALSGLPEFAFHEIAIGLNSIEEVDSTTANLQETMPEQRVETYKEISPDLELFNSQIKINLYIMTAIVMLALIFGIINTMLMAVLERMKELGMLMAIGMNKVQVFFMIMLETLFLGMIGAPLGMGIGALSITALEDTGIDLSLWSAGLKEFGLNTIIYPETRPELYYVMGVGIALTALLAAIYPALKAIKLKPVEALRKI